MKFPKIWVFIYFFKKQLYSGFLEEKIEEAIYGLFSIHSNEVINCLSRNLLKSVEKWLGNPFCRLILSRSISDIEMIYLFVKNDARDE